MDVLFTANIIIDGETKSYDVHFIDEAYVFTPAGHSTDEAIRLRREEDEWKVEGNLNDIAKSQAISALESYLLSQH